MEIKHPNWTAHEVDTQTQYFETYHSPAPRLFSSDSAKCIQSISKSSKVFNSSNNLEIQIVSYSRQSPKWAPIK